ncbi:MAG: hypothetical protein ACTSXH_12350 [Promethearchaeota archaeon]
MISPTPIKPNFIGPRALFDDKFIPPKLLYRKKEKNALFFLLNDAIMDNFDLSMLFQGTRGIGKRALVNTVLRDLKQFYEDITEINQININCREKKTEEILFSLITQMDDMLNIDINLNAIWNSSISTLWNLIKVIYAKIKNEFIIVFNNVEYLEPKIFNKFLNLGKDLKITTIYTMNKVLVPSILEVLSKFDFKNKLNFFSFKQLYDILKQRCSLAFPFKLDREMIEYIVDLIFEHHVPVPGKGIEILRDLYPFLQRKNTITQFEILESCQTNFETLGMIDEFNLTNFISEENMLTIIFLDNLADYFLTHSSKFYISRLELHELYELSCEALIYEKNVEEFNNLIQMINNMGIVSRARKKPLENFSKSKKETNNEYYFMVLEANRLKTIVDTIFSNSQF